jgi:superfamily II DNA or RNA helicase
MVSISITNTKCKIVGEFHQEKIHRDAYHSMLREVCGYVVPNAEWSPSYKNRQWDGIITLYDKRNQTFPTGLLSNVTKALKVQKCEFRLLDNRIKPDLNLNIETNFQKFDRKLYDYQESAVERAMKVSRGILALATGAGKTMLSCELIAQMKVSPVIFTVPSRSLLKQTHKEFEKYLSINGTNASIGMLGDGICKIEPNGINVTTYQTALAAFNEKFSESKNKIEIDEFAGEITKKSTDQLKLEFENAEKIYFDLLNQGDNKNYKSEKTAYTKAKASYENRLQSLKNKESIRDLFKAAQAIIVDEAHLAAIVIEALANHADKAYYRFGLSATPWREDNQEIRIEGCLGKKLIEITPTYLINRGFLVPPIIYMIPIKHVEKTSNYADAYTKHITKCWERNYRIKQFAESFQESNRPTLIIVDRIEHGNILEKMINNSIFVPGSDKGEDDPDDVEQDYRRRMLNKCENNEIILIGTQWLNTGIDAPKIGALIMAGSTQASATVLQTIGRVIRSHKESNKTEAVVIDFMDSDKHLRKHSLLRKRVYQSEEGFELREIKI